MESVGEPKLDLVRGLEARLRVPQHVAPGAQQLQQLRSAPPTAGGARLPLVLLVLVLVLLPRAHHFAAFDQRSHFRQTQKGKSHLPVYFLSRQLAITVPLRLRTILPLRVSL